MTRFRPRISGVTVLAAAVLVLLPALAWLQYSWLDQIADADRERRERTLQTAASQLAQDFDGELGKAVLGLQIEPAIVEEQNWAGYAERYQLWADAALTPEVVKSIYFVDGTTARSDGHEPRLRVWNPGAQTFDQTPWPEELASIRTRFLHDSRVTLDMQIARPWRPGERDERRERGAQRVILPPTPGGDEQSIIMPVMRISAPLAGDLPQGPPDVRMLGFTIIRLNLAALGADVLPVLVRRHLFNDGSPSDYLVAVVGRENPNRVIFESEPGAATLATDSPDATMPLLGARMGPFMLMGRDGRRGPRVEINRGGRADAVRTPPSPAPRPPEDTNVVVSVIESRRNERGPLPSRLGGGPEGHWRLVAKHRAGSLEAAVVAARTRNFALSSGILLLLATAIGLIVVSARRADRLARQQLEFVAAVSHELRTPVSVIGAAAGNLADGVVEEPGRVKKYGATIQTEARRLAETVERVLQLAGIAAGRAAASPDLVAGHTLILEALSAVRHEIESAGVTVERRLPDVLPSVRGDAVALRSAVQNLIGNAVKYGGESRWVGISAEATGRRLRIRVEDRGIGITAEDRKQMFEPFYRGREAVARQIQGSGLGLHLVRRIVEAHGGGVTVQSEPGKGTTFTIELPIAPDATVPLESSSAFSARPSR
ncbi:MAG TPA: HAMP domain-containing sensor histidine kinase [Vicinamibacterales bacterium]|nr:HAMP domain-containing sensor histidine kinase [Vicinamibacterales bacterium]